MPGLRVLLVRATLQVAVALTWTGSALGQSVNDSRDSTPSPFSAEAAVAELKTLMLEEVVVTAQKRSENVMDVPIAISVLSGELLESRKLDSLAEVAGYVPGLSIQSDGSPGQRAIDIRGLATSADNSALAPLVATYIDDEPVGATSGAARGGQYGVDLVPYDIDRIEVLKGPQGTLYGADAMGGVIKYSLKQPDLTKFEVRLGGDLQSVDGGSGAGWNGRAAVNIPIITDVLALRVSGFDLHNAGFIDNVGTGIRHANDYTESGGRATLLWRATEDLTIKATVLAQGIHANDQTAVTIDEATRRPAYGPMTQFTYFPEAFEQQMRDYSLHIDWDLGFATLASLSSWSRISSAQNQDLSPGDYLTNYFGFTYPTIDNLFFNDQVSKFTEEARLTSPANRDIQWMLGVLYTREHTNEPAWWPAYTTSFVPLAPPFNNLESQELPETYWERAVFGNATYKITDHLDITGGIRYANNENNICITALGPFGTGQDNSCSGTPLQSKTTWMAGSSVHLNLDAMFYLRVATGYRPGGGCPICANTSLGSPAFYYPDSIINYEVGFKGEFLEHHLLVDTSIFYIDWTNIQVTIPNNGVPYIGNAGSASSSGMELTTSYAFNQNLRVAATLDYTNAHLTADAVGAGGGEGEQLPISPRWTGSLAADYVRPLSNQKAFLLGGGYRYRDAIVNQFATFGPTAGFSEPMGPQNIVDLYTGIRWANLTTRLYAKNVFDNRSYTGVLYIVDQEHPKFVPIQPRTVGISVDYRF